jgi:hypothetical protein
MTLIVLELSPSKLPCLQGKLLFMAGHPEGEWNLQTRDVHTGFWGNRIRVWKKGTWERWTGMAYKAAEGGKGESHAERGLFRIPAAYPTASSLLRKRKGHGLNTLLTNSFITSSVLSKRYVPQFYCHRLPTCMCHGLPTCNCLVHTIHVTVLNYSRYRIGAYAMCAY